MPPTTEQTALPAPESTTGALPEHASPSSTGMRDDGYLHPADGPDPAPRSGSWTRVIVVVLIIAAAVAFIVYRIHTNNDTTKQQAAQAKAAADRPVPVAYDVVRQQSIPIFLTALGTVTPYNTVTVKSRVDGEITSIRFREGQHVNQGELLMQIDPRPYQAALTQAQGNLSRDLANEANAKTEAARYSALYNAGVVSNEVAQQQESSAGQASGTVQADRAAVESARVNLAYTRITAPITGIVGLRQVDIGNIISANSSTGLIVITQVEPIAVIFTLPEDQLPQVFQRMRSGQTLTAEAWDRTDTNRLATGKLLTVDNQIDTTTGTAKLKAVFNNHDGALFPNQFVNVHLILQDQANAITIPAAAMQTGSQGNFVYVVDRDHPESPAEEAAGRSGQTSHQSASGGAQEAGGPAQSHARTVYPVHVQDIAVDVTQGSTVIVRSGLRAGEWVVTDGQEKLTEKSKVIPRPAARGAAAQPTSAATGAAGNGTGSSDSNAASTNEDMYSPGPATDEMHRPRVGASAGRLGADGSTIRPNGPRIRSGQRTAQGLSNSSGSQQ